MNRSEPDNTIPEPAVRRLVIGSVQFGMPYGVTNTRGQITSQEVSAILARGYESGVRLIDTAAGYGTSEAVLGGVLPEFPSVGIVTKIPPFAGSAITKADITEMRNIVLRSLDLLRRAELYGLLLHRGADLLKPGGERISELLNSLKQENITKRVGVSVYDSEEVDGILDIFRPDIVQIPISIFDQRFVSGSHVERLRAAGVEIHARSVFLQGVLLTETAALPEYFRPFERQFERYSKFVDDNGTTRLAACLDFVMGQSGAHHVLIGITSVSELDQILAVLSRSSTLPPMDCLASNDLALIDPRKWHLAPLEKSQR